MGWKLIMGMSGQGILNPLPRAPQTVHLSLWDAGRNLAGTLIFLNFSVPADHKRASDTIRITHSIS